MNAAEMSDDPPRPAFDETAQRQKAINAAREALEGLFDGLVLLGTWQTETGETATVHACDGNWHAQNGAADYFLTKRRETAKCEARDQHRPPEDE
jgi:hypothetical protein